MTYLEAQQYILSLSNLETRNRRRKEYQGESKLREMQTLLDIFQNPERKIPHYIHVTGTSGKGSVCFFLFSLLTQKYKKVGMCVSPHPSTLLERWHFAGKQMTPTEFVEIVKEIKRGLLEYTRTTTLEMPSFFMIMTLIGFLYFAKKGARWAIFEVGIGGRYDSTNILPYKDYAVITNIGYDHMNVLGETKEEIAHHKAGIIKKGCKVFTMEKNAKIIKIFQQEAQSHTAPLQIVKNISKSLGSTLKGIAFEYSGTTYHLSVLGEHQIHNAILCIEIAQDLGMTQGEIKKALQKTKQPLRLEVVNTQPFIILDGAHNIDKIKSTVQSLLTLKNHISQIKYIHLTVGLTKDRQLESKIRELAKLGPKTISCARNTTNPFSTVTDPREIKKWFQKYCPKTKIEIFLDPQEAFLWSQKNMNKNDVLLSTGSIFYSGELRKIINQS